MKSKLKQIFFSALFRTGAIHRLKRFLSQNENILILNLHKVSPHKNSFWSPLAPYLFEELLDYLIKTAQIITFADLQNVELKVKKPKIILSFDDGHRDFLTYALPILRKRGVRANQNIIPKCVETNQPLWNVKIYDFLQNASKNELSAFHLPGFNVNISQLSENKKIQLGLRISSHLKNRPQAERKKILAENQKLLNSFLGTEYSQVLNRKEVLEISSECELGLHSYEHESMAFESDDYFRDDVSKCKIYCNELLKKQPDIYAFPNGSYKKWQVDYILANGFRHTLLVDEKFSRSDSFVHPRRTFYADSIDEVRLRGFGHGMRL